MTAARALAHSSSYCQLNFSQATGSAISALAQGDLRRAAGYAPVKRPAA
jgi:hypothetical protein